MNCATGKGVTVKAKDERCRQEKSKKLDGKTTSGTRISSSEAINALVTKKRMGNRWKEYLSRLHVRQTPQLRTCSNQILYKMSIF